MIALVLSGALYSCNQQNSSQVSDNGKETDGTAVVQENDATTRGDAAVQNDANAETDLSVSEWNGVDLNMPHIMLPEITVKGVEIRGDDRYTNYSVDETLLFGAGKAELSGTAKESLQEVAASISKRAKGKIRIYGHTDAVDSKESNKELSAQRAQAVKQWLVQNANIEESRISVHPMGESKPEASNKTEAGRQQNRRVEIVAMTNE